MNERLKELAEEAKAHADYYAMLSDNKEQDIFTEFFAMLIVKECIAQCNLIASWSDTLSKNELLTDSGRQLYEGRFGGAISCITSIEEHFGVI